MVCICSLLSETLSAGGDNARVSAEAFWWETDSDLLISPFCDPVCIHKDLSK